MNNDQFTIKLNEFDTNALKTGNPRLMTAVVLEESGHESALLAFGLSHYDRVNTISTFFDNTKRERMMDKTKALAGHGGGHDSFLKHINIAMLIRAPRYFWIEFDTYKVGVSILSSSTMHVLAKRQQNKMDFTALTSDAAIDNINAKIKEGTQRIDSIKADLPEGYLMERVVTMSYMAFANIANQRMNHRVLCWDMFIKQIMSQLQRPELIKMKSR